MTITIHAEYNGIAFIPIDSVPLKKNRKYRLIIEDATEEKKQTAWDVLEDHIGSIDGPEDWSENLDHYLYGSPKKPTNKSLNE